MSSTEDVKCPFCGDEGFDLIGLKDHITGRCKVYQDTMTIEEEAINRRIETEKEKI